MFDATTTDKINKFKMCAIVIVSDQTHYKRITKVSMLILFCDSFLMSQCVYFNYILACLTERKQELHCTRGER